MPRKPSKDGSKLLEDVAQLLDDLAQLLDGQVVELVDPRVVCPDVGSFRLDNRLGGCLANLFEVSGDHCL